MLKFKHEYVNDDWARVYLNGEVVVENHSIRAIDLLGELKDMGLIELEETEVEEDC